MPIRETSIKAYREINEEEITGAQHLIIARLMNTFALRGYGLTRNEISRLVYMPINAVCGRVNELIKDKFLKERQDTSGQFIKRIDPETHRSNLIVELA